MMQLEIKGNKWQLCWGSGALESLCDDLGIGLQDIDLAIMTNETKVLNHLTYAALMNGAELQDKSLDFNYKYFLNWLDQQTQEEGKAIMSDFMKSKILGRTMEDRFMEVIERVQANESESDHIPKVKKKSVQ